MEGDIHTHGRKKVTRIPKMEHVPEETEPIAIDNDVGNTTEKDSLINSSDEDSDVFNEEEGNVDDGVHTRLLNHTEIDIHEGGKVDDSVHTRLLNHTEIDIHEHNTEDNTSAGEHECLLNNNKGSANSITLNNIPGINVDDVEIRQKGTNESDTGTRDSMTSSPRYTKHFHPRRKWRHIRSVTINSSRSSDTDANERLSNSSESPTRTSKDTGRIDDATTQLVDHHQRVSECASENTDDESFVKRRTSRRRRFFSETRGLSTVTRQFSLFMDKDFRYYFQHPYFRLILVYSAVLCSYLNYSLDPVSHSVLECSMPLVGNGVAFISTRYPPDAMCVLKVALWIIGAISGLLIGKYFIHGIIFNRGLRLKMFNNSRGSWMIMVLCSIVMIFLCSLIYNGLLSQGGVGMEQYMISSLMGMTNAFFMKFSACASLCGDFFTAWLIVYVMLTESLYPAWATKTRMWYKPVLNRVLSFFLLVVVPTTIFIFLVLTQLTQVDKYVRKYIPSNELSRGFLASFLLVIDLLVIMQDWDFPHFPQPIEVPLDIPILHNKCCQISISGKWFKYGVLLFIMILDLNMWKNQIVYTPYGYGQYIDSDGGIYAITNKALLENAEKSTITFDYRNSTLDHWTRKPLILSDVFIYSKYRQFNIGVKLLAFLPSIITLFIYGILTWKFGRFKPTKEDPYAGRLKKRFRDRFSIRIPDELRRKIHVVSAFMNFRKSSGSYADSDENINTSIPLTDVR